MTALKTNPKRKLVSILLLGSLMGCGSKSDPASQNQSPSVQLSENTTSERGSKELTNSPISIDPKYLQTFQHATLTESIPEDQLAPPDTTFTGKSTGSIRDKVEKMWPKIALTDRAGKPIPFIVSVVTSEGSFEITLRPDIAPNHVRNMIALIQTQYYDELVFDRHIDQEYLDVEGNMQKLTLIRGGCPLGTGDIGIGHLGYFMKPEFSTTEKHEEGTVGFWRDSLPETAGCRFYIMTTPAPNLDGEYTIVGKVTKGLEVVKKIALMPRLHTDNPIDSERPKVPVVIKEMKVSPATVESSGPFAQNNSIRIQQ